MDADRLGLFFLLLAGIIQEYFILVSLNVIKLGCNYIISTYLAGSSREFAFVIAGSARGAPLICTTAINKTCLPALPTGSR